MCKEGWEKVLSGQKVEQKRKGNKLWKKGGHRPYKKGRKGKWAKNGLGEKSLQRSKGGKVEGANKNNKTTRSCH